MKTLVTLCLLVLSYNLRAESPGIEQVQITNFYLEPSFRFGENKEAQFAIPKGALDFKSNFSTWVDLKVSVVTGNYLNRPKWSDDSEEGATLGTLKGTLYLPLGEVYAGQFRIPWGYEGTLGNHQLWIPRSLFYETRQFPGYDTGVGISSSYNNFYFNVVAHNGEGAGVKSTDNRFFLTGQWGYDGPAHSKVGVSLSSGYYTDKTKLDTRYRAANVFFGFNILGLGLQTEGSFYKTYSASQEIGSLAWHADAQHPISDWINLVARFEQLTENMDRRDQVQTRHYWGLEVHSQNNSSRFFLFYIKNLEAITEVPNDQAYLAWRFTTPSLD